MNLDFFNNLSKKINDSISDFTKDLNNFLENNNLSFKDGDCFTVDRFENDFAILENRKTGSLINVSINKLPSNINEGDILSFKNGNFVLDKDETIKLRNNIKSRFNKLKKKWLKRDFIPSF